jgi:hypothetical protein
MKQILFLLLSCIFTFATQVPAYAAVSSKTIPNEISLSSELPIKPSVKKTEKKAQKAKAKPGKQTQTSKKAFIIGAVLLIVGIGNIIYILVSSLTGTILIVFIVLAALMALLGIIYIISGVKLKKQGY